MWILLVKNADTNLDVQIVMLKFYKVVTKFGVLNVNSFLQKEKNSTVKDAIIQQIEK